MKSGALSRFRLTCFPGYILCAAAFGILVLSPSKGLSKPRTPRFKVIPAPYLHFPGGHNANRQADFYADSNSPSHWDGDTFYVLNSWEQPWVASGSSLTQLGAGVPGSFNDSELPKLWIWIESSHKDADGTLYAWYHNEIPNLCPPRVDDIPGYPVSVKIGALRSKDNGVHWENLGFIIEPDPESIDCRTEDMWYAGGTGDFSVHLDATKQYFYFYFTNYSAVTTEQGICAARLKFSDRNSPRGKIQFWIRGSWGQQSTIACVTPIFPAEIDTRRRDGRTYWGPSIHWNSYLRTYVMVLNKIKDTTWATEGLYITFNKNIANPNGWSRPELLMTAEEARHANPKKSANGWYVQVMGTRKGETDKLASRAARLFVDGQSRWELDFQK